MFTSLVKFLLELLLNKRSFMVKWRLLLLLVQEKSTGSEWILDDWLLHNFKLTADEKKKARKNKFVI